MKKEKELGYDMLGIRAQRAYDQNPEAQFSTKESMSILAKIIKDHPVECRYAHYLKMLLVDGYSLREMGQLLDLPTPTIQKRINQVTDFLKFEVKKLKSTERKTVKP